MLKENRNEFSKIIISVVVLIIVTIISIGVLILSAYLNMDIYTNFANPEEIWTFGTFVNPVIIFANNSPVSINGINTLFLGKVTIVESSGPIECKVFGVSGKTSCESITIDLASIDSGHSKELKFSIDPDGNDFVLKATPYLEFFIDIELPSKSWECILQEDSTNSQNAYLCSESQLQN